MRINQKAEFVRQIIDELIRFSKLPVGTTITIDKAKQLPSLIGTGDGHGIAVSGEINRLIERFARTLLDERPQIKGRTKTSEWTDRVRRAFGPELQKFDPNIQSAIRGIASW